MNFIEQGRRINGVSKLDDTIVELRRDLEADIEVIYDDEADIDTEELEDAVQTLKDIESELEEVADYLQLSNERILQICEIITSISTKYNKPVTLK